MPLTQPRPTLARRVARALALSSLLLFSTSACAPLDLLDAMVPQSGYAAETAIAYGSHERQKLDVYRPVGVPAPGNLVVVWLYGGSWKGGDRGDYRFVGQTLASRGYLTVVPDYRLFPEARFPAFNEDAAMAVAWVRRHLRGADGEAPRVVLAGHSAGAHIAALVALDERYLRAADVDPDAVAGVVAIAGPLAFDPLRYRSTRAVFEGTAPAERFSPMTYARADAPPMLLVHGTSDGTVYPWNSERMADRLRTVGAPVRHVPVDGLGHYRIVLSLAGPFTGADDPVLNEVMAFLGRVAP